MKKFKQKFRREAALRQAGSACGSRAFAAKSGAFVTLEQRVTRSLG